MFAVASDVPPASVKEIPKIPNGKARFVRFRFARFTRRIVESSHADPQCPHHCWAGFQVLRRVAGWNKEYLLPLVVSGLIGFSPLRSLVATGGHPSDGRVSPGAGDPTRKSDLVDQDPGGCNIA